MNWFQEQQNLVVEENREDLQQELSQGFEFSISNGSYCLGHGTTA